MKFWISILVFMLLQAGGPAFAKSKKRRLHIPLMSQKKISYVAPKRSTARAYSRVQSRYRHQPIKRAMSLAVQFGIISQRSSSPGSLLGINAHMGLRFLLAMPISRNFTLEPVAGYYFDRSSLASVSLTHHWLETGANALYIIRASHKTQYRLGAAGRFDMRWNRVSAPENSDGSSLQMGVRMGPTVGLSTMLNRKTQLITNAEVTWDITRGWNIHPALYIGLAFPL